MFYCGDQTSSFRPFRTSSPWFYPGSTHLEFFGHRRVAWYYPNVALNLDFKKFEWIEVLRGSIDQITATTISKTCMHYEWDGDDSQTPHIIPGCSINIHQIKSSHYPPSTLTFFPFLKHCILLKPIPLSYSINCHTSPYRSLPPTQTKIQLITSRFITVLHLATTYIT